MTDPINTQNRLRNTPVSGDARSGASAKTGKPATDGRAPTKSSDDGAIVELSNATLLEQIGEQIKNLPEVNEARVEAVKQAIGRGEYQPDAEVIARKYAEIEKLLP